MEQLNIVNEYPRFQSYMSAEEDDRKMLNTYKDKTEKAYSKGIEQNKKESCNAFYQNGVDIEIIAKSLSLSID